MNVGERREDARGDATGSRVSAVLLPRQSSQSEPASPESRHVPHYWSMSTAFIYIDVV